MPAIDFPLNRLSHEHGWHVQDEATDWTVFHAPSAHSLIQAAGYLKHTRAKSHKKGVFFRGQARLYPTLEPSLFRGVRNPTTTARMAKMQKFLASFPKDDGPLRTVQEECREGLLQHYGVRTTWLDVVDNIWVALWFACHKALSIGRVEEYLHFEKRIPRLNGVSGASSKKVSATGKADASGATSGDADYAYVLLLESAFFEPTHKLPGHYRDARSETIDLRVAAPSHFVRPHAQHGVLIRRLSHRGLPGTDLLPLLVGVIRVDLAAALDWLGTATTLTVHSLFPPAFYDYGYRELLNDVKIPERYLGAIHRVQA